MDRSVISAIVDALHRGDRPRIDPVDFPCFSAEATQGNPHISPQTADAFADALGEADIPVFQRALAAIDEGELAWLGFKVVFDAAAATTNTDNQVTKNYGDVGSADGRNMVFFCNDAREIEAPRDYSPRDLFQMKDVTRGPSMHNEQFAGLTWCSVPLFDTVRVWLLGASDAAAEVAALAHHVGFDVTAVDYDDSYLNADRFPDAHRVLLAFDDAAGFDGISGELAQLPIAADDYVCVLTRGHMWDPQACLRAVDAGAHYVGMMGCSGKNSTVHDLCIERGMSEDAWDSIKRPIGLKFGAKTPAELAIAIVAELVDVRYRQRFDEEARNRHDENLGRD